MKILLGLFRFFLFMVVTSFYMFRIVFFNTFFGFNLKRAMLHTGQWSTAMLKTLSVKVTVEGTIPDRPVLYLPNHRSYIDAVVTAASFYNSFVIKSEVSQWPLMGKSTRSSGHIFVNRGNEQSRIETREKVKQRLLDGYSVTVFPEGTTYKGPGSAPFKMGMFIIAAEANIPIVPVAIEYKIVDDAWVGNDTFVPHFLQCFGKQVTHVTMSIGPLLQGNEAAQLHQEAFTWVQHKLTALRSKYDEELKVISN